MINNLVSRRSESRVAPATGSGRVIPARVRPRNSQTCYHRNQQYSIVGLTNAAGTRFERYTYSAYGTLGIYAANGTVRSSSTYANRYTYTGREWDAELRLYHFRARWYDPATGGFVSRDPLRYVDGMSLYRGYFGVRGVDPSGLDDRVDHYVDEQIITDMRAKAKEKCRGTSPTTPDNFAAYQRKMDATCPDEGRVVDGITVNYCNILLARSVMHTRITDLLDSLRNGDCKVKITCENCEGISALGGFSITYQRIILCANNLSGDLTQFYDTLYHELIHANQFCWRNIVGTAETRKANGKFACFGVLMSEMEAYYCDGSCGQNMGSSEAAQDCLIRAIDSACESCYLEELNYYVVNKALRRFVVHHKAGSLCRFPGMPNRG